MILNLSSEEIASATKGKWYNLEYGLKISKISNDNRKNCNNALFFAFEGDNYDGHNFLDNAYKMGAKAICINSEKKKHFLNDRLYKYYKNILVVEDTIVAFQLLAKFYRDRLKNTTFIAITGSNGKTSTKNMLKEIFKYVYGTNHVYATLGNTNNHIGVPQNIFNLNGNEKVAILELGTNHPGEIATLTRIVKPDISIITSIGKAHIEFLNDLEGVATEKGEILSLRLNNRLKYAIIPYSSTKYKGIYDKLKSIDYTTFGDSEKSDIYITDYTLTSIVRSEFSINIKKDRRKYKVKLPIPGKHQAINSIAAIASSLYMRIPAEISIDVLSNIKSTDMRMECKKRGDLYLINDAYNANPDSIKSAIEYIKDLKRHFSNSNIYIVLGDMLELGKGTIGEHLDILKKLANLGTYIGILCYGELLSKVVKNMPSNDIIKHFNSKQEIIKYIKMKAKKGDILYLKGSRALKLEEIEKLL